MNKITLITADSARKRTQDSLPHLQNEDRDLINFLIESACERGKTTVLHPGLLQGEDKQWLRNELLLAGYKIYDERLISWD